MTANRVPLAVLRRLRRALIYTPLDHLVGRKVRVAGAASAKDEVIAALADLPARAVATEVPNLERLSGAIAKYGILDLTYSLSSTSLPMQRPGLAILQAMGLRDGDEEEAAMGHDFLADMASECEGPQITLKVFLRSEK